MNTPYLLQPNSKLDLHLYDQNCVEHTFITNFQQPVGCQQAAELIFIVVVDRLGPCNDQWRVTFLEKVYNTFIMLYHHQQQYLKQEEEGPDLV